MNTIYSINGSVIKVKDTKDFSMREMVYVGVKRLIGEVIGVTQSSPLFRFMKIPTGLRWVNRL